LLLHAGHTVIDCGSNIGTYTRLLALSGAQVHSFDPEPFVAKFQNEIVKEFPNVNFYPLAVHVKNGTLPFFRKNDFSNHPSENSMSSSLYRDKLNISTNSFTNVKTISLPDFINDLGNVRILKMDIEGGEIPILEELLYRNLFNKIDIVFVETHEDRIPSLLTRTNNIRYVLNSAYPGKFIFNWN
jgi:FkbM family methyltransferase